MKYIALFFIRFYQYAISPHLNADCRFYPSCSVYAYEAVSKYGFFRGCYLAAKRLVRCRPFGAYGYDPVP